MDGLQTSMGDWGRGLKFMDMQKTYAREKGGVGGGCKIKAGWGWGGGGVPGTEMEQRAMGLRVGVGRALCQHVPQAAATQSRPAGCQTRVSCVISPPLLHHVH